MLQNNPGQVIIQHPNGPQRELNRKCNYILVWNGRNQPPFRGKSEWLIAYDVSIFQIRSRKCDSPPPSLGAAPCPGTAVERRTCEGHKCPIDGGWSEWGEYGFCSKDCEPGVKIRFAFTLQTSLIIIKDLPLKTEPKVLLNYKGDENAPIRSRREAGWTVPGRTSRRLPATAPLSDVRVGHLTDLS